MRVIFLGPPGVGKGTQAEYVAQKYHIQKISTGDLLRESVTRQTTLGQEAKSFMDKGELVPDKVVIGLVQEKLSSLECQNGFLLDGFPRTVNQANELSDFLRKKNQNIDHVVYFSLPKHEIINRLSGRRSCPKCKAVYHLISVPPKQDELCDVCHVKLVQRNDDKPETIDSRLSVYHEQTEPLIKYYRDKGILFELNGLGLVPAVQERLLSLLTQQN